MSSDGEHFCDLDIKTQSEQLILYKLPLAELKQQTSAPSYLNSLKNNDLPPFRKPRPEPKPKLLIGTFLTAEEVVDMIIAAEQDRLRKFLVNQLIKKNIIFNYEIYERNFLLSFIEETIRYGARHNFGAAKLACLLCIYVNTHVFFKSFYWLPPTAIWYYFKENLIRHSVEDSPDGQEVFAPEEAFDILTHFHKAYISNLPLIHIVIFGAHRLKFEWQFKKK